MFIPIYNSGKLFKQYLLALNHPSKVRLQNLIGKKIFSKGIDLKNENGVHFALDVNDWITRIILKEGDYEQNSTALAKSIMNDGGLFVDIGANFGLFCCQIAIKHPAVKVIAIEPNYKIIGRLLQNIELNGIESKVQVLNLAVSARSQLVQLMQPAYDNVGTTQTLNGLGSVGLSVMSRPLSEILNEAGVISVKLLKIDVEGNEFDILKDFDFDRFDIKNILLEFNHLSPISLKDLLSFFDKTGFEACDIFGEPLISDATGIPENNIWFVKRNS